MRIDASPEAIHLVQEWLVIGPLAARTFGSAISMAGTPPIHPGAHLFRPIAGSRLDLGLPLSLAIAFAVWFLLTRTRRGFEWRATGAGAEAGWRGGFSSLSRGAPFSRMARRRT